MLVPCCCVDISCCSPSSVFGLATGRPAMGAAGGRLTIRDKASSGFRAALTVNAIKGEDMSKLCGIRARSFTKPRLSMNLTMLFMPKFCCLKAVVKGC